MNSEYLVTWEINICAKTPEDAARQAFEIMQRQGTTATVFNVVNSNGDSVSVDLLDGAAL